MYIYIYIYTFVPKIITGNQILSIVRYAHSQMHTKSRARIFMRTHIPAPTHTYLPTHPPHPPTLFRTHSPTHTNTHPNKLNQSSRWLSLERTSAKKVYAYI